MIKNYLTVLLMAVLTAFSINQLSAQEKKEYKVVVIEKSVDENGNVTEQKVVKEGEEAKAYVEKMNSGDQKWITKDGEEIDLKGKKVKMLKKQQYKTITLDEDGNEKVLEWNGEGDMPQEIKDVLEEHDIDIVMSDDPSSEFKTLDVEVEAEKVGDETVMKVILKEDGESEEMEIKFDGDDMPEDVKKKLKEKGIDVHVINSDKSGSKDVVQDISVEKRNGQTNIKVVKEEDGKKEEMKFEYDGDEMPEDVKAKLKEMGLDHVVMESAEGKDNHEVIVMVEKEEVSNSKKKAQLGVMLVQEQDQVIIDGVVTGTAADEAGIKEGDIITAINNEKITSVENLVSMIGAYGVGDELSVDLIRDSKNHNLKVKLKEKKEMYKVNWDSMNEDGTSKKIEKKIIIKKD